MQIEVGYKKPRRYLLTPSRKPVGKALARGSRKSLIDKSMKDCVVRKYVFMKASRIAHAEITALCSDKQKSLLRKHSASDMKAFTWDALLAELQSSAPLLMSVLLGCTRTKRPRANRKAVIGMCAALLLRHRYEKMSLVQKLVSLILYTGHSGKQVLISPNNSSFTNVFL